jgi:mRNA interferase HigB
MNVIKRKTLAAFWTKHPRARQPLIDWFKICRQERWRSFADTKAKFGANVDQFQIHLKGGLTPTVTAFDIHGNHVRVIALVDYLRQRMLITHVFTHREYDKWLEQVS